MEKPALGWEPCCAGLPKSTVVPQFSAILIAWFPLCTFRDKSAQAEPSMPVHA